MKNLGCEGDGGDDHEQKNGERNWLESRGGGQTLSSELESNRITLNLQTEIV